MRFLVILSCVSLCLLLFGCPGQQGKSGDAFKIAGKNYTMEEIKKLYPNEFFKVEKSMYDMISQLAEQIYVDNEIETWAKTKNMPVKEAKDKYFDEKVQLTDNEIYQTLEMYKDSPQLKAMPKNEKLELVKNYLQRKKRQTVMSDMLTQAKNEKKMLILYPKPLQPKHEIPITDKDVVKGPANAKVTIVEFSDFQCPYCSRVAPMVKEVLGKFPKDVKFIFKHFPLDFHQFAELASQHVCCAGQQGKFWELHDTLFENQAKISDKYLKELIDTNKLGLDTKKFNECLAATACKDKVAQDKALGEKIGVPGTPAFFINGRMTEEGISAEAIEEAMKAN